MLYVTNIMQLTKVMGSGSCLPITKPWKTTLTGSHQVISFFVRHMLRMPNLFRRCLLSKPLVCSSKILACTRSIARHSSATNGYALLANFTKEVNNRLPFAPRIASRPARGNATAAALATPIGSGVRINNAGKALMLGTL